MANKTLITILITSSLFGGNFKDIKTFMINNKFVTNVSRFSPKLELKGRVGSRTQDDDFGGTSKDIARGYLQVTIPIWDMRTKREREELILTENRDIIEKLELYFRVSSDIKFLKQKIKHFELKNERAIKRVEQGIIYLDEQLTVLELLMEQRRELESKEIELEKLKLILLEYVLPNKRESLASML